MSCWSPLSPTLPPCCCGFCCCWGVLGAPCWGCDGLAFFACCCCGCCGGRGRGENGGAELWAGGARGYFFCIFSTGNSTEYWREENSRVVILEEQPAECNPILIKREMTQQRIERVKC